MKKILQRIYNLLRRDARSRRITELVLPRLPADKAEILDLGCGTGDLGAALQELRPDLKFMGLDVYPPPKSKILRALYDGVTIPYPDEFFDYSMLITVLHHTDDYIRVLKEALRVAKKGIILLDHQYTTRWDWLTVAFIDSPGNIPFDRYTPYNFKTRREWVQIFEQLHLREIHYDDRLYLFGKLMDPLFGRRLHFISVLEKQ